MNGNSGFGGAAAAALRGRLGFAGLPACLVPGALALAVVRGLVAFEALAAAPFALFVVLAAGLAWQARDVSGADPLPVAARLVLVSAAWIAPWGIWGVALADGGVPSPFTLSLFVLGCVCITPPALIAATTARGTLDVLRPAHWSRQLDGRGDDLFTLYLLQTGVLGASAAILAPAALWAGRLEPGVGLVVAGVGAAIAFGGWAALTGALCSAFVENRRSVERAAPRAERVRFDEGMVFAGPAVPELNRDLPEMEPDEELADEEPEPVADDEEVTASEEQALDTEDTTPADDSSDVPEAERFRRYATPAKPVAYRKPTESTNRRRTPLLDADRRVDEAMKRFRLDPSYTLTKLAELNARFLPSPHVLQALAICLHRTGHREQARRAARDAFQLCFKKGLNGLAAAMFFEFRNEIQNFELDPQRILTIAGVLERGDQLAAAAKAYSLVVQSSPRDIRATKALLDLADRIRVEKERPEAAEKVYRFLLNNCSESGLGALIREGLDRCSQERDARAEITRLD